MADSPRSSDLPLAKRRRVSEESCVRVAGHWDGVQDVGVGDRATAASDAMASKASAGVVTRLDPDSDSGFQDMDSAPPASSTDLMTRTSLSDERREEDDAESCASDVSDLSGEDWKPAAGPIRWVQKQVAKGSLTPREILQQILPHASIPADCDDMSLWRLIVGVLSHPPKRRRLTHINSLDHVVELICRSRRIIVLTGAGVSVSCGIPDFRSRDGVYARLAAEFPSLPDPQSMFDIHYFRRDPRPFFKFAKEIYPGQFAPSVSHKFIKLLESQGKLLRNYTQNIDTLEQVCGLQRVINCHGSFSTATCTKCGLRVEAEQIRADVFEQRIPLCPQCPASCDMAVMKPDIVFFGEGLSDEFHSAMSADKDQCDLLLVMGSSLKVRPVALIPSSIDPSVPQILINREPLTHMNFDVELLGDCDVIVQELSNRLGESWTSICSSSGLLRQLPLEEVVAPNCQPQQVSGSASSSGPAPGRKSIADSLPENSYLFIPPARYVFRGAELFEDSPPVREDDCEKESSIWNIASDDSGSSDSSSSDSSSCPSHMSPALQTHDSSRVSSSEWIGDSEDSIFNAGERET